MKVLTAALCILLSLFVRSQNVGIGVTPPLNRLHVFSTADPLRLDGVSSGAVTDSILTINSTGVVKRRSVAGVFNGGTGWLLAGNTGSTTTFLGTTNLAALNFRTFNQKSGFIDFDSTKRNNAIGNRAQNGILTGIGNNAFGYQAQFSLTGGNNNVSIGDSAAFTISDGSDNIAIGANAMESSITSANIAIGTLALNKNAFTSNNIAIGYNALTSFTGAANGNNTSNIAIGNGALSNTISSTDQLALGHNAGLNLTTGSYNTVMGHFALSNTNATASNNNTIIGYQAGPNITSSSNNTYLGYLTGGTTTTGNNNTFIGYQAGPVSGNFSNSSALGSGTAITASNSVRLGNTSTTNISGAVTFTTTSDERVKTNVREDVKGLSFISLLRPVTYNYDPQKMDDIQKVPLAARTSYTDKLSIRYSGFLAQEVEAAAKKVEYDFSGVVKPKNEQSLYGISYSEIVVPLVKAVQELKAMVESQQQEIDFAEKTAANGERQLTTGYRPQTTHQRFLSKPAFQRTY